MTTIDLTDEEYLLLLIALGMATSVGMRGGGEPIGIAIWDLAQTIGKKAKANE